jgi:signal transduction histidine kinase/ActR/RegA family two-component response regulator
VRSGEGRVVMDSIRDTIQRMVADEESQLAVRSADSRRTDLFLLAIMLIGIVLIGLLAGMSIWLVGRSAQEREAALRELETVNAGLEAGVAERTDHLRQAVEEVRRSADIMHKTLTSMADAVLVADETGTVVISNPAAHRLFGARADIGSEEWQRTYRRYHPDGVTPLPFGETPISRAVRGEAIDGLEIALRREGTTQLFHLIANGRPILDSTGAPKGAVLIYRDVTETRETERQLRQAQKMEAIGQLTGGIAHDFNNILTVIMGTIGILTDALSDKPQLKAIAEMIDEATVRGADLTQHLLAFARRQPLQPRPTDVNALVSNAGRLLRPTLGEQVDILTSLEPETWAALVDPTQLTTAVINLAVNARDAMPTGGKLTLETDNVVLDESYVKSHADLNPGEYVMIAVSDSGSGIPAHMRERVFEPFFTTKALGQGTGLGLSMVYGFVKQSNGHIKIYSEEGHGTTIKIYLPRACVVSDAPVVVSADMQAMGGAESILVVEDDTLVRDYVTAQLKSLGYATHAVASADDALMLVDGGFQFDLLLTDVILAGEMTGKQLADQIARRRPRLKVLFTSGYTQNAIIHHGRLDPGVLLLAKPYRKSELARMVRVAIEGGSMVTSGDRT